MRILAKGSWSLHPCPPGLEVSIWDATSEGYSLPTPLEMWTCEGHQHVQEAFCIPSLVSWGQVTLDPFAGRIKLLWDGSKDLRGSIGQQGWKEPPVTTHQGSEE